MPESTKPLPLPDELTAPYWDAARDHRLAMQRCGNCGRFHFPPVLHCLNCFSTNLTWQDVSGDGTVRERAVVRMSLTPGFEKDVPYVGMYVELDEQPGLIVMSNLVNAPITAGQIGDRVRVCFQDADQGFVLPQFEPAGEAR